MSNRQLLTAVDSVAVLGRTLRDAPIKQAAGTANWTLGSQHTQAPMLSMSMAAPMVVHDGAPGTGALPAIAAPIRLPVLSDRHLSMQAFVLCAIGAGDGADFTFTTSAGAQVRPAAPIGLGEVDLGTIDVTLGGGYDDINLLVEGKGGSTVSIHGLRLVPIPRPSPLPAESISGAMPIGVDEIAPDGAHSAVHNRRLRDAAEVGYERARVMAACVARPGEFLPRGRHGAPYIPLRGADETLHFWAFVDNVGNPAAKICPAVGTFDVRSEAHRINVGAGFIGWIYAALEATETTADRRLAWPIAWAGLDIGDGAGRSTKIIRSFTIWGGA